MLRRRAALALLLGAAAGAAALAAEVGHAQGGGQTPKRRRGYVVVGVPLWIPPFGAPARAGGWTGLDVALARGVAGVLFGNPERAHLLPLQPSQRLWAVTSGAAQVVAAAYAAPGDVAPRLPAGVRAVGPYYSEPVALMVRRGRPVAAWRDLDGEIVGLLPGAAGAGALREAAAAAGASPVLEEETAPGRAAADLALGRLRALLGGAAACRALAAYDPELRVEVAPAFGRQSYWALVGAAEPDVEAAVRRAIEALPRGPALAADLRAWAVAATGPPGPRPPLLTPPPAGA